jgi:hypothetical protein
VARGSSWRSRRNARCIAQASALGGPDSPAGGAAPSDRRDNGLEEQAKQKHTPRFEMRMAICWGAPARGQAGGALRPRRAVQQPWQVACRCPPPSMATPQSSRSQVLSAVHLATTKTREKADAAVAGRAGRQLDEGVPTMHQGHRGTCGQWIDQLIDMISTQKILARRARGLSKHVRVSFPPF